MHKKDALTLNDLISLFSIIGVSVSLIMLVGVAGAVDCDSITLFEGTKKIVIWLIVMALSVIGLAKVERDEEDIYDRL